MILAWASPFDYVLGDSLKPICEFVSKCFLRSSLHLFQL